MASVDPHMASYFGPLRTFIVEVLHDVTWAELPNQFAALGLSFSWPGDTRPGKSTFLREIVALLEPDRLLVVAHDCLQGHREASSAGTIEDALWWVEAEGRQKITEVTRGAIAQALESRRISGLLELSEFVDKVTPLFPARGIGRKYGFDKDLLYVDSTKNNLFDFLFAERRKEFKPVRVQSSIKQFLKEWGVFEWPDKRFILFLEALVRPEVRQGKEQAAWVAMLNAQLQNDGFVLVPSEVVSTYPVFTLHPISAGVAGAPKNIIFASKGPKPEIGFKDAINNEIVILKHEASCLVFDEAIPRDGLLWEDLVHWWARKHGRNSTEEAARRYLGKRLMDSLSSEPEKLVFATYFSAFRQPLGPRLPALIPQVYLHYDPKTLAELAGRRRLIRQRMDFLLLLPNQARVVIEVDGAQHYSDTEGCASPHKYAEMVSADRELRLLGYEVYRFGGSELQRERGGEQTVTYFFEKLFAKHSLYPR